MYTSTITTTQDSELSTQHSTPAPLPSTFLTPGTLTLLLGDPGTGKSLLALDLAARLTNNSPPPPHPHTPRPPLPFNQLPEDADPEDYSPGSILALSREDSHYTLISRLLNAGADRERIIISKRRLSLLPEKPEPEYTPRGAYRPRPKKPVATLLQYLQEILPDNPDLKLLILDPLPAFLGTADSSSANLIRELLQPLLDYAEDHRFAILGISHLNKSTHQKNLLHRSLGSLAYPALARSIYLVTHDPKPTPSTGWVNPPSPARRLLIPLKTNLAPITHALAFSITKNSTLQWEPTPITDHPLLNNPENSGLSTQDSELNRSQLAFALDFLQTALAHGPILSIPLLKEARSLGISRTTYFRARDHLNIQTHHDGPRSLWLTHLPHHSPNLPEDFSI